MLWSSAVSEGKPIGVFRFPSPVARGPEERGSRDHSVSPPSVILIVSMVSSLMATRGLSLFQASRIDLEVQLEENNICSPVISFRRRKAFPTSPSRIP